MLKSLSAAALAVLVAATGASAATVSFSAATPTNAPNPLASSISGTVLENTTGSVEGVKRSPFQGGAAFDDNFAYTSVGGGASATFDFGFNSTGLSFIWGSPDTYNLLTFYDNGSTTGETLVFDNAGANLDNPFATITTALNFDRVMFSSGSNAFEFAELSVAAVPVPASGLLLLSALGGIGLARRRKRA